MRFLSRSFLTALVVVGVVLGAAGFSPPLLAQSCGTITSTSIQHFPSKAYLTSGIEKEAGSGNGSIVTNLAGITRLDVSSSPATPSLTFVPLDSNDGGPLPLLADYQGVDGPGTSIAPAAGSRSVSIQLPARSRARP